MDLIGIIEDFENEQDILEETCEKCENFRNGYDGPYCMFCGCEPLMTMTCDAFEFSEFWKTKRGY